MADAALEVTIRLRDQASRALRTFGTAARRVADQAARSFRALAVSMARIARNATLIGSIVGALAVRTFVQFEQAMNTVRARTGAVGEEFESLTQRAKDLGRTTVFSATQAAEGMTFLAQAGLDTTQVLEAIGPALSLAAAGNLSLAESADIATNVVAQMGLRVDQLTTVVDQFTATSITTNTNVRELGNAFVAVGDVAASAGQDLETINAALGVLANAGRKGELAGTGLRQIFLKLVQTSGAVGDEIRALGVDVVDAGGNLRSLTDIVEQFERAQRNAASATEFLDRVSQIFGTRGAPTLLALIRQGSDQIRRLEAALKDVGGIADDVARIQMAGLSGALKELRSVFEGFILETVETLKPALLAVVGNTRDTLQAITEFVAENRERIQQAIAFIPRAFRVVFERVQALFASFGDEDFGDRIAKSFEGAALFIGRVFRVTIVGLAKIVATWAPLLWEPIEASFEIILNNLKIGLVKFFDEVIPRPVLALSGPAGVLLGKVLDQFSTGLGDLRELNADTFQSMGDDIDALIGPILEKTAAEIGKVGDEIEDAGARALREIPELSGILDDFREQWRLAGEDVENASDKLDDAADKIARLKAALLPPIKEDLDAITAAVNKAREAIGLEPIGESLDETSGKLEQIREQLSEGFLDGVTKVNDAIGNLRQTASRVAQDIFGVFGRALEDGFFAVAEKGFKEIDQAGKEFLKTLLEGLKRIAIQEASLAIIRGITGAITGTGFLGGPSIPVAARGGVFRGAVRETVPLRAFQRGGVADRPTMALFGEGRQAEAFVPLPDGKSIPVSLNEDAPGGRQPVQINFNVSATDAASFDQQLARRRKTLINMVQEALASNSGIRRDVGEATR